MTTATPRPGSPRPTHHEEGAAPRPRRKMKSFYPSWFYIPALALYVVFFAVPTFASFYFSLTRWTLFDTPVHRVRQLRRSSSRTRSSSHGLHPHLRSTGSPPRAAKVLIGFAARAAAHRHRSSAAATCARSSSSRCCVSTIGVGIIFKSLLDPFHGMVNACSASSACRSPAGSPTRTWRSTSIAGVDVWKGVGIATLIFMAGHRRHPARVLRGRADGRRGRLEDPPHDHAAAVPARDGDRHHPVADRRPAVLRHHLGDHRRRPGLHQRRDRLRDLQAVPGRLLRPVHRRQRRPLPRGHGDHGAASRTFLNRK